MAQRKAELQGWDIKHPRPRFAKVTVPGEDVRTVGSKFAMRIDVPWRSRQASILVPVPPHLLPGKWDMGCVSWNK